MPGDEDVFELPQQNEDQSALVTSNAEQEMVSLSSQSSQQSIPKEKAATEQYREQFIRRKNFTILSILNTS